MERAERDGHIHWNSLQDIVLAHPDNTFVLIHFRYASSHSILFFSWSLIAAGRQLNLGSVSCALLRLSSLRYKERTIHQFFDDLTTREENPLPLDNVVVFVGECNEGNPDN
jgi:hypothetical protein